MKSDKTTMKKLFGYILSLVVAVTSVGCADDPVIDPVTPIIKGQSLLTGALDVPIEPQSILVLFDREVVVADASRVTMEPGALLDVVANGQKVTISTLETLAYDTEYALTIGEGAIADKATSAPNLARTIVFRTVEGPHIPQSQPTMQLVTNDVLPVAQDLYSFMWGIYGKGSLSGSMATRGWDMYESDWVHQYTGEYPVVHTFNYQYLHLSPSQAVDYGNVAPPVNWWESGGVVAIDWTWMVPRAEGSRQYTCLLEETTCKVANMLTEGTWENARMMADLEKVADYLLLLQAQGVPVLWRPLHEAQFEGHFNTGGDEKYWWSGASSREYKSLWQTMFRYFEQRGIRNLIWVWTSQVDDLKYYPGDEWVDMVSIGLYNRIYTKDVRSLWSKVAEEYFPHKMVSLGEMGNLPNITAQLNDNIFWSYFVPHSDPTNDLSQNFNHSSATIEWWSAAFADERVLSRRSISLLKSYQAVRGIVQ